MATKITCFVIFFLLLGRVFSQSSFRTVTAKKISGAIVIDGNIDEQEWQTAEAADKFTLYNPEPFIPENKETPSKVFFLYDANGLYVGGYFYEKSSDSIAAELSGRDGFGNNDFVGVIFDTYHDKLNGFEYFLTPLGEQWDAKMTYGGSEDFGWNAVWEGAAKIHADGWSFEMYIPYSAIRYAKGKNQVWGMNIVRKRTKAGQKSFWQSLDPNINGFLSQEGLLQGLQNIEPPLRLQFSPYFSCYLNHDGAADASQKTKTNVNGGMDVKYGINEAFTLDMTLIPDFGQVKSDDRILNLTPFEQQFADNRAFFTEGTELFSKGNLFYSRRIGGTPLHYGDVSSLIDTNTQKIIKNPQQSKLINATKISGRTQSGLGIGILNAVTSPQEATIENIGDKTTRKIETDPLTNYNVLVLDQTLKYNSSITLVNTNVTRSGKDYDANVSSFLFDLNDKRNTWNLGGTIGMSALFNKDNKNTIGYTHSVYFGKKSGRFNFNVWQELLNDKYNKSDLGYFTNNNTMDQGMWLGYKWVKPWRWYNQLRLNFNFWISRLVSPIDVLKRQDMMYQYASMNINGNAQTKNLWQIGASANWTSSQNDFYEPRVAGRVFQNKAKVGASVWWNSNSAKKYSWGGSLFAGRGGVFNYSLYDIYFYTNLRFSSKFSINPSVYWETGRNHAGWAETVENSRGSVYDDIYFSRRNINTVENIIAFKYSFNTKKWITLRARHYWSKVDPRQFYRLDLYGKLYPAYFSDNVNQNYDYLSIDMLFNWQIANGSFISIVWKDIGERLDQTFEKNYFRNFDKTVNSPQYNSLSLRIIYFLDYLNVKNRLRGKHTKNGAK